MSTWGIASNSLHAITPERKLTICGKIITEIEQEIKADRVSHPLACSTCFKALALFEILQETKNARNFRLCLVDENNCIHNFLLNTEGKHYTVCGDDARARALDLSVILRLETDKRLLYYRLTGERVERHRLCRECHTMPDESKLPPILE